MSSFANRLRKLRNEYNLTQTELANKFNSSKTTFSNYENGHRKPGLELVSELADYFDVTIDYLLGKTDHRSLSIVNDFTDELQKLMKKHDLDYIKVIDEAKRNGVTPADIKVMIDVFEDLEPLIKKIRK
ncbi:MAG: helix-turn-helix domain-containing protein [Candidatus Woesearchaeota archaeon]